MLAALLAGAGMLLLRSLLQVRSVPERVMEWLLLFVPPDLFEAVLRRFGFDAKRYALEAAIVGMLSLLALLGYAVLRRCWSVPAIGTLGLLLWLFVMLVIMPLTSAGVFAMDLLDGKEAAIGGYLAVGLTYAAALSVARVLMERPAVFTGWGAPRASTDALPRRTTLGLVVGATVAYVGTVLAVRLLPRQTNAAMVILADPQPVPSGGLEPPNPHPNVVSSPAPVAPVPTQQPAASRQPGLPEPTASRQLSRDQDGAILQGGRKPGELASNITRTDAFYVVTKNAAGDPVIHPDDWRLLVDGDVPQSFQLDYGTLRRLPAVEVTKTLECISNMVAKPELAPFGAELISTATWKGVRTRDILGLGGGPKPGSDWVAVLAADEYTSALPMDVIMDPATLLAYEMNGEVLPREHGYPARLLLPDRYGMKNPKWVIGLRPMRREFLDWYAQRNWSKTGLVQTMSRIDEPAPGATLATGTHRVAGVAYAGTRGIQKVEISSDAGTTWNSAELLDRVVPGQDRWVRWQSRFTLAPGQTITLLARATNGAGEVQPESFSLPQPDGGTGWPSLDVRSP
jgi:DMSO/TMAO reductase YedYZ molybdopterin-dependent catalytic subunit/CDP-diglyceride synthetase